MISVPKQVQVLGQELVIVWDDGREDYLPLEKLRRACPCAMCKGEPDLFGKVYRGPDRPLTPLSVQVAAPPLGRLVRPPDRLGRRPQRRDLLASRRCGGWERKGRVLGLGTPPVPPPEGTHLHQVSARPHRAPLSAVIARRVVEEQDAVRVAAAADEIRLLCAEKIRGRLRHVAEERDRVRRPGGEACAEPAALRSRRRLPSFSARMKLIAANPSVENAASPGQAVDRVTQRLPEGPGALGDANALGHFTPALERVRR